MSRRYPSTDVKRDCKSRNRAVQNLLQKRTSSTFISNFVQKCARKFCHECWPPYRRTANTPQYPFASQTVFVCVSGVRVDCGTGAALLATSIVALSIDAVSSSCSPVARPSLSSARKCVESDLQAARQSLLKVSNSRSSRSSEHRNGTPRGMKIDPQRVQNQAQIAQMGCRSAQERP